MAIVSLSPAFHEIVDPEATVSTVASGLQFTEGPVWDPREGRLTFSDIPADTMYRWRPGRPLEVLRKPSANANGNTLDREGRLLTCEHAGRRVARAMPDGRVETVAGGFEGKRLNSPNDLVCASNGDIYFTDPPYGLRRPDGSFEQGELGFNGVFRWAAADGRLTLLVDDFVRPNGLALSDDERRLFIADTQEGHIRVFDLDGGRLTNGRAFVETKHEDATARPDGIKLDREGNLYVSSSLPSGVWVYSSRGELLGMIGLGGETPANVAFGSEGWRTLFVTAQTSVYSVRLKKSGQPVGPT